MSCRHLMVFAGLMLLGGAIPVWALDVLQVEQGITATPATALLPGQNDCGFGAIGTPLSIEEAVSRALCNNPKTRKAWANVKVQAAALGVARAAWLPTLSGSAQSVHEDARTDVTGHPQLSSNTRATVTTASVALSWVLYDFGARAAATGNASALLAAAQATQDATLQTVFAAVAQDYYEAQAAQGGLIAAEEVEQIAGSSLTVAQARVDRGIAPVSDALQAHTAYAQAILNREKAQRDEQVTLGALAADMGLSPDAQIALPAVAGAVRPDARLGASVAQLLDEAQRSHPAVAAALARIDAATARVAQSRAQGLPSLSLVGRYSRNNQPASLGLGIPSYPANGRDSYVGMRLSIPIFEGFARHYQNRQAEAQVELQHDLLDEVRQDVALEVWRRYQELRTAGQNVSDSATLLDVAQRSYAAARQRYRAGLGAILELLNAQASLANAKQQRIQALADWHNNRLQLAASLGQLSLSEIAHDSGDPQVLAPRILQIPSIQSNMPSS